MLTVHLAIRATLVTFPRVSGRRSRGHIFRNFRTAQRSWPKRTPTSAAAYPPQSISEIVPRRLRCAVLKFLKMWPCWCVADKPSPRLASRVFCEVGYQRGQLHVGRVVLALQRKNVAEQTYYSVGRIPGGVLRTGGGGRQGRPAGRPAVAAAR